MLSISPIQYILIGISLLHIHIHTCEKETTIPKIVTQSTNDIVQTIETSINNKIYHIVSDLRVLHEKDIIIPHIQCKCVNHSDNKTWYLYEKDYNHATIYVNATTRLLLPHITSSIMIDHIHHHLQEPIHPKHRRQALQHAKLSQHYLNIGNLQRYITENTYYKTILQYDRDSETCEWNKHPYYTLHALYVLSAYSPSPNNTYKSLIPFYKEHHTYDVDCNPAYLQKVQSTYHRLCALYNNKNM